MIVPVAVMNIVRTLSPKGWLWVAAIVVVLGVLTYSGVNRVLNHFSDNKQVAENNKDREIREDLSEKREDTNTDINQNEREVRENLDKLPDQIASPRRISRACVELRRKGLQPLPPECGPSTN